MALARHHHHHVVARSAHYCLPTYPRRAVPRAPLESGISSSSSGRSGSSCPWAVLSDESNTFWQLLHAPPGSSRWSVVTPPGVADNGGLVLAAPQSSTLVGFLPSGISVFAALAEWRRWEHVEPGVPPWGACVGSRRVGRRCGQLGRSAGRSWWPRGVSSGSKPRVVGTARHRGPAAPRLPECGVSDVSAVAFSPSGEPMVASNCSGRGAVGVFTRANGAWQTSGSELRGAFGRASTSVVRLASSGTSTVALVADDDCEQPLAGRCVEYRHGLVGLSRPCRAPRG